MPTIRSMPNRRVPQRKVAVVRRKAVQGLGSHALSAHGGIFRHDGPRLPYESLETSAYNDGALGAEAALVPESSLEFEIRKLTIVVGCTGLLVAGILFTMVMSRAEAR